MVTINGPLTVQFSSLNSSRRPSRRFAFYSLLSNHRGVRAKVHLCDTLLFAPFDKHSEHATELRNHSDTSTVTDTLLPFSQIIDSIGEAHPDPISDSSDHSPASYRSGRETTLLWTLCGLRCCAVQVSPQ